MTDTLQSTTALATLLEERLVEWEKARKPQELKMLECYQDVMRIPREDDVKGTGAARTKKTTGLFVGSTRNKVRAARAKICDALFGSGKLPFDTNPTNEDLSPFADAVEDILTEQFERMKLKALLKTGVNTLATYGTGFMFGPLVREECLVETTVDMSSGYPQLQETEYKYDGPYFELGNTLDVYPDPEAREVGGGLGVFWATMESPHTVAAWKADKSYSNVEMALLNPGDNTNETGSEIAGQQRANLEFWFKNDRIKVARFFGKVPKSKMPAGEEDGDTLNAAKDDEMMDVIVIMAGGVVVKVSPSPYKKNTAMRCVYEAVEHEMWGVGVAENNGPHQKITNAAFRLFMEGKGMALLGTKSVDRSKFLPTEDFKKFPGKVYQFKPGLSLEEKKEAIQNHVEPDITGGWIDVIRMSEQFSDDDTGITKYTQGDDSSHLNKTASGISMIMSASSLPIKEVIQNIDEMWIEEIVERTIEWDLKYLEVETVQKIHGDEIAQLWAQIKEFGKTSFMDWQATGTSSFMQKEVLTNKIRAFAEFAMGNPVTAPMVDARELLQQTWDVMEIGRESPIMDEEKALPPQIQQQLEGQQQQIEQMGGALEQAGQAVNEKDKAIQAKDGQLEQERSKSRKLEIQLFERDAMDRIKAAEEQAMQAIQAAMVPPEPVAEPEAPAEPPLAEQIAPFLQAIAEAAQGTQQAVSELAEGQQQIMQGLDATAQRIEQAVSARPKQSTTMRIRKDADGSYVGERTE